MRDKKATFRSYARRRCLESGADVSVPLLPIGCANASGTRGRPLESCIACAPSSRSPTLAPCLHHDIHLATLVSSSRGRSAGALSASVTGHAECRGWSGYLRFLPPMHRIHARPRRPRRPLTLVDAGCLERSPNMAIPIVGTPVSRNSTHWNGSQRTTGTTRKSFCDAHLQAGVTIF